MAPSLRLLAIPLIALFGAQAAAQQDEAPRVIVLGFDGADHNMVQRYIEQGELPNLEALAERGTLSRLETTNPAESAVSWSTFGRGLNPGRTTMFGFVSRMPGTYFPELRFMKMGERPASEFYGGDDGIGLWVGAAAGLLLGLLGLRFLGLGGGVVAAALLVGGGAWLGSTLGGDGEAGFGDAPVPTLEPVVEGKPLWSRLDEAGLRVRGFLVPMSTPVPEMQHGGLAGGLGVPDVAGRPIGSYFVLSSDPADTPFGDRRSTASRGLVCKLQGEGGPLTAEIPGPVDLRTRAAVRAEFEAVKAELEQPGTTSARAAELRGRHGELNDREREGYESTATVTVERAGEGSVTVTIDGKKQTVPEGQWSDWMPMHFALPEPLATTALARFRVLEAGEHIKLFFPALGFDPRAIPQHLCAEHPPGFSAGLAERSGPYDTTGWACMTNPLKDEEIDEQVFLEQIRLLTAERKAVLLEELARDDYDFYFAMFGETDRVQHLMFRLIDPENPMYDAALAEKYGSAILDAYKAMDDIVGEVMQRHVDERTHLLVVSDHGFTSFRRQMAINTWLIEEGYLVPRRGGTDPKTLLRRLPRSQQDQLRFMDPARSRAFALGLGKIYINLQGREANGIVPQSEYEALCEEIKQKLLALRDPQDGAQVVNKVWRHHELYTGPHADKDADLYLGFAPYYRISWSTTVGGFSAEVLEDNDNKWSGDHASNDPDVVPGILVSNRPLAEGQTPAIVDMTPTILGLFGVDAGGLDGRVLQFQPQ